jgi:hypothetical protein
MPRTCKFEAPILVDEPVIEGRYVEMDGYTVGFESVRSDADPAVLFRGLPDDRCQCPHWGVVQSGHGRVRDRPHRMGATWWLRRLQAPTPVTAAPTVAHLRPGPDDIWSIGIEDCVVTIRELDQVMGREGIPRPAATDRFGR